MRDYPIRPVPSTDVRIEDRFGGPRLATNRSRTIPALFEHVEAASEPRGGAA
jgi:hypothetical protein